MRKCPGAWAGGRQEGGLIRQRTEFIRPWRVMQCTGEAQNAESNKEKSEERYSKHRAQELKENPLYTVEDSGVFCVQKN